MNVRDVLPKDAIPSIDTPTFSDAYFGSDDDEVLVVDGDPPRAYPIRILSYHEIVNDTVDGVPVAVTWCPICWSAVVYDRRVDDRVLTFGTSGKLADDALVMYDRETETEWKQPTGEAIAGTLSGRQLTVRFAPMMSWETFRAEYPEGMTLQPVRGTGGEPGSPAEIYDMEPYREYAERETFGLYGMRGEGDPRSWARTDIDAKTPVLGVEVDSEALAFPVPEVEARGGIVTERVGGTDIVVFTTTDGIYGYENPGFAFERREGGVYADGTRWDPKTGKSEDGRQLDQVAQRRMFAFAWQDAHGPDSFWGL